MALTGEVRPLRHEDGQSPPNRANHTGESSKNYLGDIDFSENLLKPSYKISKRQLTDYTFRKIGFIEVPLSENRENLPMMPMVKFLIQIVLARPAALPRDTTHTYSVFP